MTAINAPDTPVFINSEKLAYWYLRLNGFLTTVNFVLHPDTGTNQRTDVDILGVRFPYRRELILKPMIDDAPFTRIRDVPFVVIAEVKRGLCALNGPWTDPDEENMHSLLRAIGIVPKSEIKSVAEALYSAGHYSGNRVLVSLFCFGSEPNADLQQRYPSVPQRLWSDVLAFIFDRFMNYRAQKASHGSWDETGARLYDLAIRAGTADHFRRRIAVVQRPHGE
jgi:hypothetical protein